MFKEPVDRSLKSEAQDIWNGAINTNTSVYLCGSLSLSVKVLLDNPEIFSYINRTINISKFGLK